MYQCHNVVFTLKSPLHIGFLPASGGSVVSQTRYYVPGKNLWGAITRRITENLFDKPVSKDYQNIGKAVKDIFRFSYFYIYDNNAIYFPEYNENKGMIFGEKNVLITRPEFEAKFIGSRVLTEIEHESNTAKDKSLHEIEYIKDRHIDEDGNIGRTKLAGCIFIKGGYQMPYMNTKKNIEIKDNGIFIGNFNLIEELTLGGEQNYGFGLVEFDSFINENKFYKECKKSDEGEDISINIEKASAILSHLEYIYDVSFKGDIEILTGRGYYDVKKIIEGAESVNESVNKTQNNYYKFPGKVISDPLYYFSPGTKFGEEMKAILNWDGTMKKVN